MTKRALFRLLFLIIAIVVAFFAYRFIFVASPAPEAPGVEPLLANTNPGAVPNDEFLKLLEQVKGIQLAPELVFNHPSWLSLENFRKELGDEPRGRINPFSPPGFDGTPPTGGLASTTEPASTTRAR